VPTGPSVSNRIVVSSGGLVVSAGLMAAPGRLDGGREP
jgi:hypothetical protein